MAGKAGKSGKVIIGSDTAVDVTGWSIDSGVDMLDDTDINGDGAKTFIAGLSGYTATVACSWNNGDTAQAALNTAHLAGSTVAVKLYVDGTSYYSGTCYINSLGVALEKAGIVTQSFGMTGTGLLVYNAS